MPDRAPGFVQRTAVDCEPGAVSRLADHLQRLGSERPVVLMDARLSDGPIRSTVERQIGEVAVASPDEGEPTVASIAHASEQVQATGADAVIAVGGGSTMDTAKLLRGLMAERIDDVSALPERISGAVLPLVTIPTTAGTGAELGAGAVYLDPQVRNKVLVKRPELVADVAIADGDLTTTLPPSLTAWTGLDAFAQAVLAFVPAGPLAVSGQLAKNAIALIHHALPRAVQRGDDRTSRAEMMLGSVVSALAMFNAPSTYAGEHLIAEPIGAALGIHHGHAVAALLPGTAEYNAPHVADRFAELAQVLNIVPRSAETSLAADAFVGAVRDLVIELGVEPLSKHTSVTADDAATSVSDLIDFSASPRPLDQRSLRAIVRSGFDGTFQLKENQA